MGQALMLWIVDIVVIIAFVATSVILATLDGIALGGLILCVKNVQLESIVELPVRLTVFHVNMVTSVQPTPLHHARLAQLVNTPLMEAILNVFSVVNSIFFITCL